MGIGSLPVDVLQLCIVTVIGEHSRMNPARVVDSAAASLPLAQGHRTTCDEAPKMGRRPPLPTGYKCD